MASKAGWRSLSAGSVKPCKSPSGSRSVSLSILYKLMFPFMEPGMQSRYPFTPIRLSIMTTGGSTCRSSRRESEETPECFDHDSLECQCRDDRIKPRVALMLTPQRHALDDLDRPASEELKIRRRNGRVARISGNEKAIEIVTRPPTLKLIGCQGVELATSEFQRRNVDAIRRVECGEGQEVESTSFGCGVSGTGNSSATIRPIRSSRKRRIFSGRESERAKAERICVTSSEYLPEPCLE